MMNGYPLVETLLVVLLVGASLGYIARSAWRGVRAAGAARGSACGGCNACDRNAGRS